MRSCVSWAPATRLSGSTGYDPGDTARTVAEHADRPQPRLGSLHPLFDLVPVLDGRVHLRVYSDAIPRRARVEIFAAGVSRHLPLLAAHADSFGQHGRGARL